MRICWPETLEEADRTLLFTHALTGDAAAQRKLCDMGGVINMSWWPLECLEEFRGGHVHFMGQLDGEMGDRE